MTIRKPVWRISTDYARGGINKVKTGGGISGTLEKGDGLEGRTIQINLIEKIAQAGGRLRNGRFSLLSTYWNWLQKLAAVVEQFANGGRET